MLTDMLRRLTDAYSRDPNSNLGRLLGIAAGELEDLREAIQTTRSYRDLDLAQGVTLDRIGRNVAQYRGMASDYVYRVLIRSKIARNLSDGSVNTLIRVLAVTLDIEPGQIRITERWPAEPAAIQVDVPPGSLLAIGFSLTQFGRLVNRIVAAGVRADVLQEGTFVFSSVYAPTSPEDAEFDDEAGFNDLDEFGEPLNIGGQLGAVYDPDDDPDLPV